MSVAIGLHPVIGIRAPLAIHRQASRKKTARVLESLSVTIPETLYETNLGVSRGLTTKNPNHFDPILSLCYSQVALKPLPNTSGAENEFTP